MWHRLVTSKFFQPYKIYANEEANRLHLLYLFGLGGLITDRAVSYRTKLIYALWITLLLLFCLVPSTLYIYEQLRGQSGTLKIDLIISALSCACIPLGWIGVDLLGFFCRNNLIRGIKAMSLDFGIEGAVTSTTDSLNQVSSLTRRKFNDWDWFTATVRFYLLGAVLVANMGYASHFFLTDRTSAYNDFYYWSYPTWKMEENASFVVYTTITIVDTIVTLSMGLKAALFITFIFCSGDILANYLIKVAYILETESSKAKITFELITSRLLSDEVSQDTAQIMRKRVFRDLIGNGVRFIQNYRRLRTGDLAVPVTICLLTSRATEDWKLFVEISFMLNASFNFILVPATVYQLLQGDIPVSFKISNIAWVTNVTSFCYASCYFGKVIEDAADILKDALYNTPWYQLQPRDRKMMHLMICELQQSPITLSSFIIYPLGAETFPRILNLNYTILNLITMLTTK